MSYEITPKAQEIHDQVGIKTINIDSPDYPGKIRAMDNPPETLYALGDIALLNADKHAAIIGTRNVSMKGMDVAIGIANMLAQAGEVVVSGLADGCDTGAHLGTLGAGGKTIAILPTPITQLDDDKKLGLANQIIQSGGLLISEYPHGTPADSAHYIARDRLQAALSDGLIVVESHMDGGEMQTVSFAEEMGKLLGAYRHPGGFDATTTSEGNEYLIKERGIRPMSNMKSVNKFMEDMNENRRKK